MAEAQQDIFQFYTSSADTAPGKGNGETLVSSPDKFKELRKIPGWRRTLAAHKVGEPLGEVAQILPLTHGAQLWYAPPRAAKVRREDLEEMRLIPTEMADASAPSAKAKVAKAAKAPKAKAAVKATAKAEAKAPEEEAPSLDDFLAPEGEVLTGLGAKAPENAQVPDMDAPEAEQSAIRFCPTCRYYLYIQVEGEEQNLFRVCRNCGHREEDVKGGMVMEMKFQSRASDSYKILLNEYTRQDPRLPHLKTIPCPDQACDSNHGKVPSDVIYIKHDAVNMLYLYICDVCGFTWRSAR
jgi:DNA-directed RNA polymerase subunit M/transcription elongation factor TFIIS